MGSTLDINNNGGDSNAINSSRRIQFRKLQGKFQIKVNNLRDMKSATRFIKDEFFNEIIYANEPKFIFLFGTTFLNFLGA